MVTDFPTCGKLTKKRVAITDIQHPLSLHLLNRLVSEKLAQALPENYWIQAELGEVHPNANGHCYVEFIEKDAHGNNLIAKARGIIWSNVYSLLKPYFEQTTGQAFTAGIKVLVSVTVNFNELYGYSLIVQDIDPTYTLGDLAMRRKEILRKLKEEGVLELNKELPLPLLMQRIAIISSATAAGYGDFCNQLQSNAHGLYFYTELFPAVMQGSKAEGSILAALDSINLRVDDFDVVVIIRGGGATSDLSCFDTYSLAAICAQFALPIITGIGHERDDTVLDMVSHTRVKTPTAAAEFLLSHMEEQAFHLEDLQQHIQAGVYAILHQEHCRLEICRARMPKLVIGHLSEAHIRLANTMKDLKQSFLSLLSNEHHRLDMIQQQLVYASPERLLAKGYSITFYKGRPVTDALSLSPGDIVETHLHHGTLVTLVKSTDSGLCVKTEN